MKQLCLHLSLFILALLSVHLVSWIGSVLHSVPNAADSEYAVYTFRKKQDKPMSNNFLMNILFPNVLLILLNLYYYYANIPYRSVLLIHYVIYYYIYRFLLICIILHRKELYSPFYEASAAFVGLFFSFILTKYILVVPDKVFIPVSELINEFWLIIFLLIYKFIILLLDKIVNQKNVVGDKRLIKYIRNRFDKLYKKYEEVTNIDDDDKYVWIVLYSIMIFEDYNRIPIIRQIERIKTLFNREATVGIMQVKSSDNLSDKDSIVKAYNILRNEIMKDDTGIPVDVKEYAFAYNRDEDYAESVAYIYENLYSYINESPQYFKKFRLNKDKSTRTENDKHENVHPSIYPGLTIDDITVMTGLTHEEILTKAVEEHLVILFLTEEAKETFNIDSKE